MRTSSTRRVLAPVALLAVLLGACDGSTPVPAEAPLAVPGLPATLGELTGPWRAQPLTLDPVMREAVAEACRRDIESPGAQAVLMDARGASVVTVRLSGPRAGSCDSLEITPTGEVNGAGSGWSQGQPEQLAPLAAETIGGIERMSVGGGDLRVQGWSVYGRAGAGIASVVVEPAGRPLVVATLQDGWFGAWWPAGPGEIGVDRGIGGGPAEVPIVVRGYDIFGTLLVEVKG